jgi:hypothetical protein
VACSALVVITDAIQIILLDNGMSMSEHWISAVEIVKLLVSHGARLDDNGLDFYVTNFVANPEVTVRGTKKFTEIKRAMDKAAPKPAFKTEMARQLGTLFWENFESLRLAQRKGTTLRKMTFFILTDGKWEGTENRDDVGLKIANFVKRCFTILGGDLDDRAVSIQLIQFGQDSVATETFRYLDDDLWKMGIPYVHVILEIWKLLMNSAMLLIGNAQTAIFIRCFSGVLTLLVTGLVLSVQRIQEHHRPKYTNLIIPRNLAPHHSLRMDLQILRSHIPGDLTQEIPLLYHEHKNQLLQEEE